MSDARAELMRVIADAAAALAGHGPPALPLPREGADTRARIPVAVPQATGQDGAPRGVWVRALSAQQRLDAEAAAHRWTMRALGAPPQNAQLREAYLLGYERLLDRRTVVEEVARMVVEPPDLPVTTIEGWGDAVVQTIHLAGVGAEGYPAELIAAELARLHGGPPPPPPGSVAGEPQSDLDDVADGAERADRDAA